MDTISLNELKRLSGVREANAISIFLPTHLAPAARQDAIRLKNLLDRAEAELHSRGMRRPEAVELLKQARSLASDAEFWKHLSQGLVLFITPHELRAWRLPLAFEESLDISPRLAIKRLLAAADRGERFLLLALSQNDVRLFSVTRSEITRLAADLLPENERAALNYAGADRGEQVHSAMHGSLGKQAAVFHGQGGEKDTAKRDLEQYFQVVARALQPLLARETAPLLLAGVDYLLPIFRSTCGYPQLAERHLAGNCDLLSEEQLFARSWEIMQPTFDRPRQQALERLPGLLGTGRASADAAEIASAALAGKVETLLADVTARELATVDPTTLRVTPDARGTEEVVNLAVAETLTHAGQAFAVAPSELPGGGPLAAIYRY